MKAVNYFDKYANQIMRESAEGKTESAVEMFSEMFSEIKEICRTRNAVKKSAIVSAVKEVNQKWNKVRKLIKEIYTVCPLKENAIQIKFIKDNPSYELDFVVVRGMEKFDPEKAKNDFEGLSQTSRLLVTMAMIGSHANNHINGETTQSEISSQKASEMID